MDQSRSWGTDAIQHCGPLVWANTVGQHCGSSLWAIATEMSPGSGQILYSPQPCLNQAELFYRF
jgi:hypothetical protein